MTKPITDRPDVDLDPKALLPDFPGLDRLLASGWQETSEPAQIGMRTLTYSGDKHMGDVILVFRPQLVDVVAIAFDDEGSREHHVAEATDLEGILTRWAARL